MLIRPAHPSDAEALLALEQSAAAAAHWTAAEYRRLFEAGGPQRLALVAERDGAVTGFIVARTVSGECEIENVVVREEDRRHGIGSALLWTALEYVRAEGRGRVFLEVRESNVPAQRLYAAAGFRQAGRRKGYYHDPEEDGLILECSAPGAARKSD